MHRESHFECFFKIIVTFSAQSTLVLRLVELIAYNSVLVITARLRSQDTIIVASITLFPSVRLCFFALMVG